MTPLLGENGAKRSGTPIVRHELHHDVEAVFWVIVYLCLWVSNHRFTSTVTMDELLDDLGSLKPRTVLWAKKFLLSGDACRLEGEFMGLRSFLTDFVQYHSQCSAEGGHINSSDVLNMVILHRDRLLELEKELASQRQDRETAGPPGRSGAEAFPHSDSAAYFASATVLPGSKRKNLSINSVEGSQDFNGWEMNRQSEEQSSKKLKFRSE